LEGTRKEGQRSLEEASEDGSLSKSQDMSSFEPIESAMKKMRFQFGHGRDIY